MATKKNPGRPRKPASEKPEQFSIRLPPDLKFGLELLARKRGVSLSQACEYAIATTLRGEKFEGTPILEIAEEALRTVSKEGWPLKIYTSMRLLTIMRLPRNLRTPEEQYVLEIYNTIKPRLPQGYLMQFYIVAARRFAKGLNQREAIKEILEDFADWQQTFSPDGADPEKLP